MTTDLLEERLRDLAAGAPDPGMVTARVLASSPRRSRPVWPRVSLSAVAALVLVAGVAYFVPAAGTVVARIPFAGQAVGSNDHITAVGSSSTSSGYTLTLTGAFADSTRTVLYLHSSPAAELLGVDSTITDQFGRSYHSGNSSGNALTGDLVVQFEPLAWPDQVTGARITLNVSELQTGIEQVTAVRGSWHVSATLGVDEGTIIAPPAPGTLDGVHFRFVSVRYTPETIAVDIEMTGASSQDTARTMPADATNPKGSPVLEFEVFDPTGAVTGGNSEIDDDIFGRSHVHILADRNDVGGGRYTIRVRYMEKTFERTLTVS